MSAFNSINGVPGPSNSFILTQVLRHEWDFKGVVISDYGAIRKLSPTELRSMVEPAARKAVSAGIDIDLEQLVCPALGGPSAVGEVPQEMSIKPFSGCWIKFDLGLLITPTLLNRQAGKRLSPTQLTWNSLAQSLSVRSYS